MKKNLIAISIVLSILISFPFISGCSKENKNTISDESYYKYIAFAVNNSIYNIWNQNIAGHPSGDKHIEAESAYGGSVTINGNVNADQSTNIDTFDLVFSFSNYKHLDTNQNNNSRGHIIITGNLSLKGSQSSSYNSSKYKSSSLQITGIINKGNAERTINESGEYGLTSNTENEKTTAEGIIFGKTISW